MRNTKLFPVIPIKFLCCLHLRILFMPNVGVCRGLNACICLFYLSAKRVKSYSLETRQKLWQRLHHRFLVRKNIRTCTSVTLIIKFRITVSHRWQFGLTMKTLFDYNSSIAAGILKNYRYLFWSQRIKKLSYCYIKSLNFIKLNLSITV